MEALKCFSLYGNKITDGITVSDFESVVTVDPSATKIKQAVLQTLPVVAKCAQKGIIDFRRIAGYSLSFVHEVTGKATLSKAGVLLAVDPNKWRLATDSIQAAVVDPCGPNGHVILFVKNNAINFLSSWNSPTTVVSMNAKNTPVITTVNRGSLMLAAITGDKTGVNQPARSLVAAPTAADKAD